MCASVPVNKVPHTITTCSLHLFFIVAMILIPLHVTMLMLALAIEIISKDLSSLIVSNVVSIPSVSLRMVISFTDPTMQMVTFTLHVMSMFATVFSMLQVDTDM